MTKAKPKRGPSRPTVGVRLLPAVNRAVEIVAAHRGWSKSMVVEWALLKIAEVRQECGGMKAKTKGVAA